MGLHKVASFTLVPELPVIPHQIPRRKPLSQRPVRFSARACFGERFLVSSSSRWRNIENRIENVDDGHSIQHPAVSKSDASSRTAQLSFNRLQLGDEECRGLLRRNFGRFVAREAVLDEEYWTAAWLRAEAHWESLSYMRSLESPLQSLQVRSPLTHTSMKQIFVHVNADNMIAQNLYKKTGFQIVDAASSPTSKDQRLLMSMEL